METLGQCCLGQRSRLTSSVRSYVDSIYPWQHVIRMACSFAIFLSLTHNPRKTTRKISDEMKLRDVLQNTRWVLLRTVIKNKASLGNLQPRGAEGGKTTKCNVVSGEAVGTTTTKTWRYELAQDVWGMGLAHCERAGEWSRQVRETGSGSWPWL